MGPRDRLRGSAHQQQLLVCRSTRWRCLPTVGWRYRPTPEGAAKAPARACAEIECSDGFRIVSGGVRCAQWLLDTLYTGGPGGGTLPLIADVFHNVAQTGSVALLRTLRARLPLGQRCLDGHGRGGLRGGAAVAGGAALPRLGGC